MDNSNYACLSDVAGDLCCKFIWEEQRSLLLNFHFKIVAAAVAQAFGPIYFAVNFGLMFTSTVVFYGVLIIITQIDVLYDTIGDTGFFIFAGVAAAAGTIVTFTVPSDIRFVREQKKVKSAET